MSSQLQAFRSRILKSYNAKASEIKELLPYNQNAFEHRNWTEPIQFPLDSEPYVSVWSNYSDDAQKVGGLETLKNAFVQLHFPIQAGISKTKAYRAVTLRGTNPSAIAEATGLIFQQPDKLSFKVHASLAGAIPVLLPGNRQDFITLVRALTKRNEPAPIPASMGACMVTGYSNWERIGRYRQQWERENPHRDSHTAWMQEFRQLIPQKNLYHDRFIILSAGFYSNITPKNMGLTTSEWQEKSLLIRLEHECTHYLTYRLFGSMQNNLLDELIADYCGIVSCLGYYRADWFLRFMGLESFPDYQENARLQNYRGQPLLSDGAFKVLQGLVVAAAINLEHFDREYLAQLKSSQKQLLMTLSLTFLTIEELASERAIFLLQTFVRKLRNKFSIV